MKSPHTTQSGSTLIEVLVAILILSFGMLALGGMLAYAVQMPKLSGYRSTAVAIASGHVEKMRANYEGYRNTGYVEDPMTFRGAALVAPPACAYPNCTADAIAKQDRYDTNLMLSKQLPEGGMYLTCTGACGASPEGELWVMWTEPTTYATLSSASSDECPPGKAFIAPAPRCLHMKFKL